jgi:hypothetical protein
MTYTVGVKLQVDDEKSAPMNTCPSYVGYSEHATAAAEAMALACMLDRLRDIGAITGYSVVLKCKPEPAAPGAGP